ncbi:MAG: maleylacetoacetate isomerase [Alphaproteobacteria bacterium]|nr:maleylacetoacetate isomerase [Alphaproteobacteria bacterium]
MELYGFSYSGSAYRVRIALLLKGLPYRSHSVHLLRDGGEQNLPDYRRLNPLGAVPTLVHGDLVLTQSAAIVEYLEERYPTPPLLPSEPGARARVRALAQTFGVDVHPLITIRVLKHLAAEHGAAPARQMDWSRYWIAAGMGAFEALLDHPATGTFCHGEAPGLADIYLVPQVIAAERHGIDFAALPRIARINRACLGLAAFRDAAPAVQTDAVPPERIAEHLAIPWDSPPPPDRALPSR